MGDLDPRWFNAVLAKHDRDNSVVSVLSVTTEPASKVGDNYASVILRANLKVVLGSGKIVTKKVILKKALTDIPKEIVPEMNGAFNLEGIVYDKILTNYESMIKEHSVPYAKFWPECILTSHNMIIFEDLRMSGFNLGKRQTGLDPEHAKIVFTNLARLHSLSVIAVAEGTVFTKMLPPFLMSEPGLGESFFRASMKSLANVIRDRWGPNWTKVEKQIRSMVENVIPILNRLAKEPCKLLVVNHGDCWVNNMMFKYNDDGVPVDLKFFDFQLSHYNSYAWDLVYFLHSSLRPNYIVANQDEFIQLYSKEFAANLDRFGFDTSKAPTVQEIKDEMKRLQPFSVVVSSSILPITANPSNIQISLEEMLDEHSTKFRDLFEDQEFEQTIQAMFQHFINIKVFS